MEGKQFTWIPFYEELANKLLEYKEKRKELVEIVYSLDEKYVSYTLDVDRKRVSDIDPFSVFAIFNRGGSDENRKKILSHFKEKLGIDADLPRDFDGVPILNALKSIFFGKDIADAQISDLWNLFESAIYGNQPDFEKFFDKLQHTKGIKWNITIGLFWIRPNEYMPLDKNSQTYLKQLAINVFPEDDITASNYSSLLAQIKESVADKTFAQLSFDAWKKTQTERIWMWSIKPEWNSGDVFSSKTLKIGKESKGELDFSSYKDKKSLTLAYQKVAKNEDYCIPGIYWDFMKEIKIDDIVVLFDTTRDEKKQYHQLYGWGRFSSDYKLVPNEECPIQRDVEWHCLLPDTPIDDPDTKNSIYFHSLQGTEAANIKNLLNIDNNNTSPIMQNTLSPKLAKLLKTNHNLILTGAPGTGKTYLAKQIAKEMGCTDDEIGFVQFHPSYDYTDFVEGLRPKQDATSDSNIGFERKNGVFKDFCTRALIKQSEESIKLEDGSTITSMLNSNPTVWKVSLKGTGDNPIRHDCLENGYIRIGWHEYGNVEDFNEFEGYTQHGGKTVLKAFQHQMKEGDIIASCYSENEVDAIGIVTGGYEYDVNFEEYPRYRKVHWLVKNIRENILAINDNKKFTLSTVYRSNITAGDALKIVEKYTKSNSSLTNHIVPNSFTETKALPVKGNVIDAIDAFKKDVRKLGKEGINIKSVRSSTNFQVTVNEKGTIFATNTKGKTVAASPREIEEYVRTEKYDESHATYEPGIGKYIKEHYLNGKKEEIHIEDANPIAPDSSERNPFVFIIDEINRGEISKIFGELFFSIDPGYRGKKGMVQTQYQNMVEGGDAFKKGFYVPENVYIIGTMNDIDRSVESMDFAFRRRFAFAEIKADENVGMLDDLKWKDEAIERMKRLNEAISKTEGLSSAYHIGASYFMKLKNYNGDFNQLWEYHLEGLLHEYLRGMQGVEDSMKKLKNAYDNANPSNGQ